MIPIFQLVIYLPAYNAADTIVTVLDRIPDQFKNSHMHILVVNDGSTDDTERVTERYAEGNPEIQITLLKHVKNLGYGATQKTAYQWCIDHQIDVVAMVHADGQYAPELLPQLLEPLLKNEADLVFGSRISGNPLQGGMPLHRYFGNRFLTIFQNFFLGLKLSEYHSGYRVFSVKALQKVPFAHLSSYYDFDTEMMILFQNAGLRIAETTIPTHYGNERNYLNVWKYTQHILVTTFTFWLYQKGFWKSKKWSRILDKKKDICSHDASTT
ncbi:MAG: glycosyltransferase family 2 protein [Verrucomicrobiota bacterium]